MLSSVRSKLIALSLLAAVAMLTLGGVAVYTETRLEAALEEAEGSGVAMRNHMQSDMLHDNIRGLVEKFNGATQVKDAQRMQEAVTELAKSTKEIQEEFAKNKEVATLPADVRAAILRTEPDVKAYVAAANAMTAVNPEDRPAFEQARAAVDKQFSLLEKDLGTIRDMIEASVRDARTRGGETTQRSRQLVIGTFIVMFALLVVAAVGVYRSLIRRIDQVSETMAAVNAGDAGARTRMIDQDEISELGRNFDRLLDERIATVEKAARENEVLNNSVINLLQTVFQLSNRDLTARAQVTEDVIGTVASSINQFSDETTRTLSEVQEIARKVAATSEAVRAQSLTVEETALAERDALAAMSDNLNQATAQLAQVAQLSDQSNRAAAVAADATQNALASVQGTVQGMDRLRESISDMEKRFKRLGERSQEISAAVQLVNSISERTHVLALNASMQAATAGEAGRGFAVVAEEVQRLSDSSRQATSTISQLVGNIQAETNETLFTVNRLIGDVVRQSELAQHTGHQMNQTQQTTQQLVRLVNQIAQFSEQQARLATDLQQSVVAINAGTQETSRAIAGQTESTRALAESSRQLTEAVGQFKLA